MAEGYRKEMDSLVEDTKAWVPVSLEKSRLLRSSVPHRARPCFAATSSAHFEIDG